MSAQFRTENNHENRNNLKHGERRVHEGVIIHSVADAGLRRVEDLLAVALVAIDGVVAELAAEQNHS